MGFFAEIPKDLKSEFDRLFPAKGSKKLALVAALKAYIQMEKDARERTDFAGL